MGEKSLKNPFLWLAVGVFLLAALAGYQGFTQSYRWIEVTAALLAAALAIGVAGLAFFPTMAAMAPSSTQASTGTSTTPAASSGVANAVAFNAVIFVALGFAAIVAATPRWVVGSFWGGTCLLAGGFVGMLFGIPLHVDKDGTNGTSSTNLMVDTANAASKLVAGATLAQIAPIYHHFQSITAYLAYCLECCANSWQGNVAKSYNSSLAGGIILYFSLAGFLAGILLPKFFFDSGSGDGNGGAAGTAGASGAGGSAGTTGVSDTGGTVGTVGTTGTAGASGTVSSSGTAETGGSAGATDTGSSGG